MSKAYLENELLRNEIDNYIQLCFRDWNKDYVQETGFGNLCLSDEQLETHRKNKEFQHTLNSYLKTETDFQMKFGGYLDRKLFDHQFSFKTRLTVHAEMHLFSNGGRCDLSIHSVPENNIRFSRTEIKASTLAIIEIKTFALFYITESAYLGHHKTVVKDFKKFEDSNLPSSKILRYQMLMVECLEHEKEKTWLNKYSDDFLKDAKSNNVKILSNYAPFRN